MSQTTSPPLADISPRAWLLVIMLFFTSAVSNIDRNILSVLVEPVRTELGLTDVQISLLLGLAYGMLNGPFGLVFGYATDRLSRRMILMGGVTLWGLATMAGGLVSDYRMLFAARALVGLGEACVVPTALSMIADAFAPHLRGRALSVYLLGASIGSAVALILPGMIADLHTPLPLAPWRFAFVVCGGMALVVAVLFLFVREPPRRGVMVELPGLGIAAAGQYILRYRAVLFPVYLGFALFYLCQIGTTAWSSAFLMRQFGLTAAAAGTQLGTVLFVTGSLGYGLGGYAVDWAARRRGAWGKLAILMACPMIALPSAIAVFAPAPILAVLMLSLLSFAAPVVYVGINAVIQELVPSNMRGVAISLCGVANTVLSYSLGPLSMALVTDRLFRDPAQVGYSILTISGPALIGAGALFWMARANLRRVVEGSAELRRIMADANPNTSGRTPA